jgi:fused signal recognition particle receptor
MILWWGRKKTVSGPKDDGRSSGDVSTSLVSGDAAGTVPQPHLEEDSAQDLKAPNSSRSAEVEETDPIGLKAAAARIEAERAARQAARETGILQRLQEGLRRSSGKIAEGLGAILNRKRLDRAALEDIEDLLITSDMGPTVAARLTKSISTGRFDRDVSETEIKEALASEIVSILRPRERIVDFSDGPSPRIALFVGVNGSGKTTTIGKIAYRLAGMGADVTLAAGDTFRAAAVEQLRVWAERSNARFISRPQGSDAAALAYEAVSTAQKEGRDIVLIDTAGRLQNRSELMDELAKIVRAIRKLDASAPHDVILVLDATVGQNAHSQVEVFRGTAGVTGLVMTKLDGTAKGGVLVAIAETYNLPIHFVGVGERPEDLQPFDAETFARALVGLSA